MYYYIMKMYFICIINSGDVQVLRDSELKNAKNMSLPAPKLALNCVGGRTTLYMTAMLGKFFEAFLSDTHYRLNHLRTYYSRCGVAKIRYRLKESKTKKIHCEVLVVSNS